MNRRDFMRLVDKTMREAAKDTVDIDLVKIARAFKADLTQGVRQQKWPMAPLSPRWLAKKKKHGLDVRKVIASERYLQGIRERKLPQAEMGWAVEPSPNRVQKYTWQKNQPKITYVQLAQILEGGSEKRGIPPRPHWKPCIDEYVARRAQYGTQVQQAFAKRFDRALLRALP